MVAAEKRQVGKRNLLEKKSAVQGAKKASPDWNQEISGWKKGGFLFESGISFFGKGSGLFWKARLEMPAADEAFLAENCQRIGPASISPLLVLEFERVYFHFSKDGSILNLVEIPSVFFD